MSDEILRTMQDFYNRSIINAEGLIKFEVRDKVKVIPKANTKIQHKIFYFWWC